MKKIFYSVMVVLLLVSSGCSIFKKQVFKIDQPIPASPSFSLDATYRLYMRSICRAAASTPLLVNGVSELRDECHLIPAPNILIERQYLYYSATYRIALFIMLRPNYPRHHNGVPTYEMTEIRNQPVVNLWNANCFLFGNVNAAGDRITFQKWEAGVTDTWGITIDPLGNYVEVTSATEGSKNGPGNPLVVGNELAVNVVYRLVTPSYPMNVNGQMFDPSFLKQSLVQKFVYEACKKRRYWLYVPYTANPSLGIRFFGKKSRDSRLPYDVQGFFN
jgi:hypothetical protein